MRLFLEQTGVWIGRLGKKEAPSPKVRSRPLPSAEDTVRSNRGEKADLLSRLLWGHHLLMLDVSLVSVPLPLPRGSRPVRMASRVPSFSLQMAYGGIS